MAILRDVNNGTTYIKFNVAKKDPRPDQGCTIHTVFSENGVEFNTQFGWTNYTLHKFIEALTQFPQEIYDGYFSHYDSTFEFKWFLENKTRMYLLVLFISGRVFSLKVNIDDIQQFGTLINSEIQYSK